MMLTTMSSARKGLPSANLTSIIPDTALQQGCVEVVFSEMEYVPGYNPDSIISAEVESIFSRIHLNMLALLFLFGGSGNVINMAVFYKQGLKDRVNLCLFALALADVLNLIMAIIYFGEAFILQFTTEATSGPVTNFLINNHFIGLQATFGYVSSILSAIIACERCHCVLHPLTYQTVMSTRTMAAIIATVYVLVTGLHFFVLGFRMRLGCLYDPVTGEIKETLSLGHFYKAHKQFLQLLRSVVFGIGLPSIVIVVVTVMTIITSVKLRRIVEWRAAASVSLSTQEVALTRMLIGNSILFILCSVPLAFSRNIAFFPEVDVGGRQMNLFMTAWHITRMILYINSSFNILVYYVMGARYRETFWALFGRKTVRGKGMKNTMDNFSHSVNRPATSAEK